MGHACTNVRGRMSTNKWLHRGSESDSRCLRPIVSISSNLYRRRLEIGSEPHGLLALISVLRVGVYRLVAASLFLLSSTYCSTDKKLLKYSNTYIYYSTVTVVTYKTLVLGNVVSTEKICCTSSFSVSRSSSLVGGRPTWSLLIGSLLAARRVLVYS